MNSFISKTLTFLIFVLLSTSISSQITFNVTPQTPTLTVGSTVTLAIEVENFDSIQTMQYAMQFDSTKLTYDTVFTNLRGLSAGSFSNGGNIVYLTWDDDPRLAPLTLPCKSVIYTIRFRVKNATGVSLTFGGALAEITNRAGAVLNVSFRSLDLGAFPTVLPSLKTTVESKTVAPSSNFSINVSVEDYTKIVSQKYGIKFNKDVIKFDSIGALNLTALKKTNFKANNANTTGEIPFSWMTVTRSAISVPNSTIIYKLYFTAIGAAGTTSPIQLVNLTCNDINTERLDTIANRVRNISLTPTNGLVTISGGGGGMPTNPCTAPPTFTGYALSASKVTGRPGDTVCVRITAYNPRPTAAITARFGFDTAVIQYLSVSTNPTTSLLGFSSSNFSNTPANRVNLTWFNNNGDNNTMTNGEYLVDISFKVKGVIGTNSLITFPQMEVADANSNVYSMQLDTGRVSVSSTPPILCVTGVITNTNCFGSSNGAIAVTVSGSSNCNSLYSWKGPNNYINSNSNINNLVAGTYYLTVTNNASMKLDTFIVTQGTEIIAVSNIGNILCAGQNSGSISLAISGGNAPYSFAWTGPGVNASAQNQTGLGAGNYKVVIKDSTNCEKTYNYAIQSTGTAITVIPTILKVCSSGGATKGTISLNVSGGSGSYTYNWSGNGVNPTSKDQNVAVGNYNVIITDGNSCTFNLSNLIMSNANPVVINETIVQPTSGNNGSISLNVTGGDPTYTFNWVGNRVSPTNQNQTGLGAGTYTVTVTDKNNCTYSKTFTLTSGTLNFTQVITPSCPGQNSGQIMLNVTGGSGNYTYTWFNTVAPGTAIFTSNPLTGAAPGIYFCKIVDNVSGVNTTTTNFSVSQIGQPITIASTVKNDSCGTNAGKIIVVATGGVSSNFTYNWSNNQQTSTISNLSSGLYILTITDIQSTCTRIDNFNVGNDCNPIQIGIVNPPKCNNGNDGSVTIRITSGTAPFNVTWAGGNGTVSNVGSTFTINNVSSGTLNITVTDATNKTYNQSVNVSNPALIDVQGVVVDDNGSCNGSIVLTVSGGTTPYNYLWTGGANTKDITNLPGGTYTVSVTDAKGCLKSQSFTVRSTITPISVVANINNPKCLSDLGSITTTTTGAVAPFTYSWKNSAGSVVSNIKDLTNAPAGKYCLTISYNICSRNIDSTICYTLTTTSTLKIDTVIISGTSGTINVSGGVSPYSYLWCNNSTLQSVSNLASGNCSVKVTDGEGCSLTRNFTVASSGNPCTFAINSNYSGVNVRCFGENNGSATVVNVSGAVGNLTYSWENGGNNQRNNALLTGINRLTIFDSNGTKFECNVNLSGPQQLLTTIIPNCSNGTDGSATANVSGGTSPFKYRWNDTQQSITPIVTGLKPNKYFLVVVDGNNCSSLVETTVETCGGNTPGNDCLDGIPVFTPNQDDRNEYFVIKTLNCSYVTIFLEVYNRWGQLVFESNNYDNTWDGRTISGNILPEGGYFYVVTGMQNNGVKDIKKGYVTILRQ